MSSLDTGVQEDDNSYDAASAYVPDSNSLTQDQQQQLLQKENLLSQQETQQQQQIGRLAPTSQPPGGAASSSLFEKDSDDESADGWEQMRLPKRIRQKFTGGLQTSGDAAIVCDLLFQEQIDKAALERPPPNTAIAGDVGARTAFLLLLTDAQQRDLFLKTASRSANWPRIKSLVGSPPFKFLLPEDAGVLNAGGFAKGRKNMTYEQRGRVASYSQFGPGQLVDEFTREYRVAPSAESENDPLPGFEYFNNFKTDVMLQVKVMKVGLKRKREILRSSRRKQLLFPQPGERIVVRETTRLLSARGLSEFSRVVLRVKALWPRTTNGSTAAVLVST